MTPARIVDEASRASARDVASAAVSRRSTASSSTLIPEAPAHDLDVE
jgi:hypothetical protein